MWSLRIANVAVGIEALRIHPLRTLLSVLGITIGCAALVATMAVSDGLLAFARQKVARETSVQVVSVEPRTSVYRDGRWVPVRDHPHFDSADAAEVMRHTGALAATLALSGRTTARWRGERRETGLLLGSPALPEFGALELAAGRFFSPAEAAHRAPVVVINFALARELSPAGDPLAMAGRDIHLGDRLCRVVGVLAPTGLEDRLDPACAAYAPVEDAGMLLDRPADGRFAPSIRLLAPSVAAVADVRDAAEDWLARGDPRWREHARVNVGLEQLRQVEQGFRLLELFVAALVGISLLVGGIGIMNVLLASVAERMREIGIRKSVGARASDIRTQFLAESVAIALAGAVVGLLLGALGACAVTAGFRLLVGAPVQPVFTWQAVLLTVLSSSATGLAFGTYPARRAARLSPVVAIAQE